MKLLLLAPVVLLCSCMTYQGQLDALDADYAAGRLTVDQWTAQRKAVMDMESYQTVRAVQDFNSPDEMSRTFKQLAQEQRESSRYMEEAQRNYELREQNRLLREIRDGQQDANRSPRHLQLKPTYGGGYSGTLY